jgi:tetratricopeptide (TPR) repeat protein
MFKNKIKVVVCACVLYSSANALPPQIQKDMYLKLVTKQIKEENWLKAKGTFEKLEELKNNSNIKLGHAYYYYKAEVYYQNKNPKIAKTALDIYFDKSGQKGKYYTNALELYPKIEEAQKRTWQDPDTNLIWQKEISSKTYKWEEAKEYCSSLSLDRYNDWRLPTKDELMSIVTKNSYQNSNSSTGKTFIKKPLLDSMTMKYQWFWSSSSKDSSKAWVVGFGNGYDDWYNKSNVFFVRCVR